MRSVWMFLLVVLIAIACAGIGIYYLIPGIYHILIISETGNPYNYHLKHALLFFVLAILALVALRYVQPLPAEKIKTKPLQEQEKQQ
jgi:membrane protein implicated in regulation of membrane protease activity